MEKFKLQMDSANFYTPEQEPELLSKTTYGSTPGDT